MGLREFEARTRGDLGFNWGFREEKQRVMRVLQENWEMIDIFYCFDCFWREMGRERVFGKRERARP